ncbi:EamA family transporter [Luteimonas sp. MHLX1A]|uniref:EamA family transporter n=1 Tax=Alterluteimonas muca TaxID=2878684 RepID=UPI001E455AB7|nr:EamA family transporter [Luteimonas sp. MHLX1A]MCD9047976.1 EamA family transporter [Luteimonas sp. MHLX1A]
MAKEDDTMTITTVAMILVTLTMLACGQVLFKLASGAISFTRPETFLSWTLLVALAIYGLATVLWLAVLARVPLSQAFPFYGLSFLLVPMFARLFLGEAIPSRVWIGGAVIGIGILIASWER